jgi:co-chaperonin GroES (HSP10)
MTVAKTSYLELDAEAQIMQIHERLHVNGEESEHHLRMGLLTAEQAAAELQSAGFAAVTVHGPEPHSVPTSDTLLIVGTV